MACKGCRDKRSKFMQKVAKLKETPKERLERLWRFFGKLHDSCIMSGSKDDIYCYRVSENDNFEFDVVNRYMMCDKCQNAGIDDNQYLQNISAKLKYMEDNADRFLNYDDVDTLKRVEVAIRRNVPYEKVK